MDIGSAMCQLCLRRWLTAFCMNRIVCTFDGLLVRIQSNRHENTASFGKFCEKTVNLFHKIYKIVWNKLKLIYSIPAYRCIIQKVSQYLQKRNDKLYDEKTVKAKRWATKVKTILTLDCRTGFHFHRNLCSLEARKTLLYCHSKKGLAAHSFHKHILL